jgi:integrase/recombinase XerC
MAQLQATIPVEYLDEVTRDKVTDFLDDLEAKGRSRDYVRGWHQVIRTFVGYCIEEGWRVSPDLVRPHAIGNKWFAIRKPKAPDTPVENYTDEQVSRIIEAADSPRNRAIVRVFVNSGLRLSELASLHVDDLDFERRLIRVLGKGRRYRMVPMSEGTARALSHYMNRVRPQTDCDYVFLTLGGQKGLKPSALSAIFQRINAKVPFRAHAHALRHTYATNYARDVGDANLLQQNLGHRTPKVTQRYLHWAAEDLGRGIDKMRQF